MHHDPQDKMKFESEDQLKVAATEPYFCRVQIIKWDGPGWYYIFRYSQPCPRGCCRDDVFEAISASKWAEMLADKIKDLAYQLKEARSFNTGK
jgi:hypothetical protein